MTSVFHLEPDALRASNDPRPLDLVDTEFGDGMQQVPPVEVMEVLGHVVFSEARFEEKMDRAPGRELFARPPSFFHRTILIGLRTMAAAKEREQKNG